MLLFGPDVLCFYDLQGISSMIEFDEGRCVDLISVLPGVVTLRVALPFDEILQRLVMPPSPVAADLIHLILFFPINQIRGRSGEVWSM
jgi:hypothetical protein